MKKQIINDINAVKPYLGFSLKSGLAILGTDAVINAVKNKSVDVVLIDTSMSENTQKKIESVCQNNDIYIKYIDESVMVGSIGNINKKVIAIKKSSLANKLKSL